MDEFAEVRGLDLLQQGRRSFNHAKYLLDIASSRAEAETKARSSAKTLRSAMDWLEDTAHFEEAHRELDQAGRFIRQNFGCRLAFQDGTYRQDCPVALAHNRIGMSIGAILNKASCSICRRDPHDCSHITGRIYDGNRCVRIIEEAELLEVSLVDRPSMPDARIMSITILDSELKEQLGPNFQPGVPLSCKESPLDNLAGAHVTDLRGFVLVRKRCCTGTPNRCLSDCDGVEDRRPYQARST